MVGFPRAESQGEWRKKGVNKENRKGREDKKAQFPHFKISHKVLLVPKSAVWFFLQSGIQRAIHPARDLCLPTKYAVKSKQGFCLKSAKGWKARQHSRNPQIVIFCQITRGLKPKKKKGKQPLGLATSKGKVEQASLELIRSSLESHKAH